MKKSLKKVWFFLIKWMRKKVLIRKTFQEEKIVPLDLRARTCSLSIWVLGFSSTFKPEKCQFLVFHFKVIFLYSQIQGHFIYKVNLTMIFLELWLEKLFRENEKWIILNRFRWLGTILYLLVYSVLHQPSYLRSINFWFFTIRSF